MCNQYGVAAILLVAVYGCAYALKRLYNKGSGSLDSLGIAFAAFVQILVIGVGVFLKLMTDSDLILAACVFSGPAVVCLALIYGTWRANDFDLILTGPVQMFCFCLLAGPTVLPTDRARRRVRAMRQAAAHDNRLTHSNIAGHVQGDAVAADDQHLDQQLREDLAKEQAGSDALAQDQGDRDSVRSDDVVSVTGGGVGVMKSW